MHDVYNKLVRVHGSSENAGCAHADRNPLAFQEHSVQDLLLETLPTERRALIQDGRGVRWNLTSIGSYRYTCTNLMFNKIGEDISSYYGRG